MNKFLYLFAFLSILILDRVQATPVFFEKNFHMSSFLEKDLMSYANVEDVLAKKYALNYTINPYDKTYSGEVKIDFLALRSSRLIVLDAKFIDIQEVKDADNNDLEFKHYKNEDGKGHRLEVYLKDAYQKNDRLSLQISYGLDYTQFENHPVISGQGNSRDEYAPHLPGLLMFNEDKNPGVTQTGYPLAVTHFQPIQGRTMFPCQDTLDRAQFFTRVTVPQDLQAHATGTPVGERKVDQGFATYEYDYQGEIPVYLYALVVGRLHETVIQEKTDTLPKIVLITEDKEELINNAITMNDDEAVKIIQYLEAYLDRKYPVDYLRLAFVPTQHNARIVWGMEQQGLITFNDYFVKTMPGGDFLYGESFGGWGTLAHELAHKYFGYMLGMKSYADIAVNEGTTSFMDQEMMRLILGRSSHGFDRWAQEWQNQRRRLAEEKHIQERSVKWGTLLGTYDDHMDQVSDAPNSSDFYSKGAWFFETIRYFLEDDNSPEKSFKGISCVMRGLLPPEGEVKFMNLKEWSEGSIKLMNDCAKEFEISLPKRAEVYLNMLAFTPGIPMLEVSCEGNRVTLTQNNSNYLYPFTKLIVKYVSEKGEVEGETKYSYLPDFSEASFTLDFDKIFAAGYTLKSLAIDPEGRMLLDIQYNDNCTLPTANRQDYRLRF